MNNDSSEERTSRIGYWAWQICVTLLAGFVAAQTLRHGTFLIRPTVEDLAYSLVAFLLILAVVVGVSRLSRRLSTGTEEEEFAEGNDR